MVRGGVIVCDIEVVYEPKTLNQDIATSMTEIRSPRKLIEVALPLDDINVAAAREKSMRHGHPSTLHLWWARRPVAAAPPPARSDHDWRYFGTVTINGVIGALAWKAGGYGMTVGDGAVRPFSLWERIRFNEIMESESPPGRERRRGANPPRCGARTFFPVSDSGDACTSCAGARDGGLV